MEKMTLRDAIKRIEALEAEIAALRNNKEFHYHSHFHQYTLPQYQPYPQPGWPLPQGPYCSTNHGFMSYSDGNHII